MSEYRFQAKEGPEKIIEGVVEASTESAAVEKISQRGYVPVRVYLNEKNGPAPRVSGFRPRGNMKMFLFSNHLARLIKTGVPILKAIHLLAANEKDPGWKSVLDALESEIREGKTLSRAMEYYPGMFPPVYVSVVRAGEMSGSLREALARMAVYYKKKEEIASKIRRAMAYPAVLAAAGISSIFFIITFLVPRLEKVFAGIGHDLPMPTRFVIGLGAWMNRYWIFIVLAAVILIFFIPWFFGQKVRQSHLDAMKLRIPFFGNFLVKIEFARFCRVLELCSANGLSFLTALGVAIPAVGNVRIRQSLQECRSSVEKGSSFGAALKKYVYFSDLTAHLISVGEESGKLEETLIEIADVYEQETDEFLIYSTTFLEPMMILFVGGIIAFIVMAVLLPVFEINAGF